LLCSLSAAVLRNTGSGLHENDMGWADARSRDGNIALF
jgi:hypothetical protein